MLIGEYYFNVKANAFGALKAYKKASPPSPTAPSTAYAMYKLGWSYYNVGDYDQAIDTMKTVVTYAMSAGRPDPGRPCSCRTRRCK